MTNGPRARHLSGTLKEAPDPKSDLAAFGLPRRLASVPTPGKHRRSYDPVSPAVNHEREVQCAKPNRGGPGNVLITFGRLTRTRRLRSSRRSESLPNL